MRLDDEVYRAAYVDKKWVNEQAVVCLMGCYGQQQENTLNWLRISL